MYLMELPSHPFLLRQLPAVYPDIINDLLSIRKDRSTGNGWIPYRSFQNDDSVQKLQEFIQKPGGS